jgi:hypothetical protein
LTANRTSYKIACFAVFYSYFLIPLLFIAFNSLDLGIIRQISDLGLFLLLLIKLFFILLSDNKYIDEYGYKLFVALALFIIIAFFRFAIPLVSYDDLNLIAGAMEFKLVFYVLVALILFLNVKESLAPIVVKYAMVLAIILIFDFLVLGFSAGSLQRATSTGEVNYEAFLLVISICILLSQQALNKKQLMLIIMGLLVSMSRTGIISVLVIFLLSNKISITYKIVFSSLALFFIGASFVVRELDYFSIEGIERYWMWSMAVEMFSHDPIGLLIGFNPYAPLPVGDIPPQLSWLSSHQIEGKGWNGFYPFSFHSMWLRIFSIWGIGGFILLGALFYGIFSRKVDPFKRNISIVIILQGMTMGVFYIGYLSVITILLILNIKSTNVEYSKGIK